MIFKYDLGVTLKSLIHGFEGVAMARSEQLTGCNVYMVQPRVGADGKMPDAFWMSEAALVQTDAEKIVLPDDHHSEFKFELGLTVTHLVHGVMGVITGRAEFLGNTDRYDVQPPGVTKDGKVLQSYWFDEHALMAIGAPKVELAPQLKAGGPAEPARLEAAAGHR